MRRASLACALCALGTLARAADTTLSFGLFPYMTPQLLVQHFTPLREHLQAAVGRPVSIVTAPDYASFRDRTRAGEYAIIFTAPHLGRLAEVRDRYQRIAITRYRIGAVILVPRDSAVRQLTDLRGKVIAVPPRVAVVHMLAVEFFRAHGLRPGGEITLREFDSNHNSMVAPLRGDADAGVTGVLMWNGYAQKEQLRALGATAEIPGFVMLAHPRVPAETVERLRKAAYTFGDTPAGQAYFAATGHGAWLPIDDATMRALDRYAAYAGD